MYLWIALFIHIHRTKGQYFSSVFSSGNVLWLHLSNLCTAAEWASQIFLTCLHGAGEMSWFLCLTENGFGLEFQHFFFSVPVNMLTWACVSTSLLHVCVCACVRACVCVSVCVYMCVCVSKQANGLADCAKQNLIGQSTFIWYKKRNVLQWFPFNLIKYDLVNSFFLSIPCIYYIHAYIIISHNINHNEKSNKTVSTCANTDWAYISNVMEFIGTHI